MRKFFIFFSIIFIIVFYYGAKDALNIVKTEKHAKDVLLKIEKEKQELARQQKLLIERKNNLKKIKPIYQDIPKYAKYRCQGKLLKGTYAKKACQMINFVMVNNAYNDIKTDIKELNALGYDCDFDYQKAQKEFEYKSYLGLKYHDKTIGVIDYRFPNENGIINNKKATFTLAEALADGVPIMLWMVPKNNKGLVNGHLVTVYKYNKKNNTFYFYDTFNKELTRDFNEFLQRWQIAELHIYKKH